ncbi:MAG TPA: CPBP family intramembrane glutamic endopeptidase [Anaerolineales bacterium]|nr:CPBP family intramembrane glutamic endopeptidase [Anaerolineales bacterium]
MTTSALMSDKTNSSSLVNKYPLVVFFLLVFGLTWPFMIVDALGSHDVLPFRLPIPLMIVMGYMPTLAAVIVTGMTKGKEGIRALFRKLLIAKVGLRWYVLAIFGYAAVCAGAIGLSNLLGEASTPFLSENFPKFSNPVEMVLSVAVMFLAISLVNGEELAWRGFALPRLQAKFNALTSSVILGVIWGAFHLPLFFTLTGSSQAGVSFLGFLLSTVSLTIIFTWMYNHTRGSVLLAYLLHGSTNTWTRIFPIDHNGIQLVGTAMGGLTVLAAVIVLLTMGAENLSRSGTRIQEE